MTGLLAVALILLTMYVVFRVGRWYLRAAFHQRMRCGCPECSRWRHRHHITL